MNYVIIGNSAAGIACVEGIRQVDTTSPITIIADEKHHTYGRPLISYLLYGKTDENRMKYRPDDFYKENNVKTMLGKKVLSIDKNKKSIKLDDGKEVKYDKLLVATGSRPFVPPMDGLDSVEQKYSFMTLDDAHALAKAINKNSRVLVIGAGLIGLKCVEGIADRVKSVEVVDLADRILPSILDINGSQLVQKFIETEKGVKFYLGDSVAKFTKNNATLKSGKKLDFDVLVVAVGVRPNTELVKEIGGNVNRGIVVNDKSETSIPDIYSAGDCTECFDITLNQNRVLALLPNAYMQGETAGVNMAGGEKSFKNAIPMNAIGFFGYHVITAGCYDGEEDLVVNDGHNYKKLFKKDGKLHGYIMIGNVKSAGIYTLLIRDQRPLEEIDYDLIRETPELMAFSRKYRDEKLGGAEE